MIIIIKPLRIYPKGAQSNRSMPLITALPSGAGVSQVYETCGMCNGVKMKVYKIEEYSIMYRSSKHTHEANTIDTRTKISLSL